MGLDTQVYITLISIPLSPCTQDSPTYFPYTLSAGSRLLGFLCGVEPRRSVIVWAVGGAVHGAVRSWVGLQNKRGGRDSHGHVACVVDSVCLLRCFGASGKVCMPVLDKTGIFYYKIAQKAII